MPGSRRYGGSSRCCNDMLLLLSVGHVQVASVRDIRHLISQDTIFRTSNLAGRIKTVFESASDKMSRLAVT